MDGQRFDSLIRSLSQAATRREAVATLCAGLMVAVLPGATAGKRGQGKGGGKGRPKAKEREKASGQGGGGQDRTPGRGRDRGKPRGKGKDNARKDRQKRPAHRTQAEAVACCGTRACPLPGPNSQSALCDFAGDDLSGRDLTHAQLGKITGTGADFSGAIARGAQFGAACLSGARFVGTDLRETQFGKACLFFADLTDATIDVACTLRAALLCGTTLPDGTVSDRDCAKSTPCCPACDDAHPCGDGEFCEGARCRPCDVCLPPGDCPFASLQEAVDDPGTQDGDTIRLCPGTYPTVDVEIDKNLTIIGAGHGDNPDANSILQSNGTGRVLFIANGAAVELRDLRITGGNATGAQSAGGGIESFGDLTVLRVSVAGNRAEFVGGGIRQSFGTLIVEVSHVASNDAVIAGGGIDNNAAVVILRAGAVVEDNETTGGDGGGIHNFGGALTLEAGSHVFNNRAVNGGGGIQQFSGGTTTLQNGSRVSGNQLTVGADGSGIRVFAGTVNVGANALVCDNEAVQCFVAGGAINGPCPNPASGICP